MGQAEMAQYFNNTPAPSALPTPTALIEAGLKCRPDVRAGNGTHCQKLRAKHVFGRGDELLFFLFRNDNSILAVAFFKTNFGCC
jgi:hypothetical protein